MDKDETLFDLIAKSDKEKLSKEQCTIMLETLKKYSKKVPPFEALVLK